MVVYININPLVMNKKSLLFRALGAIIIIFFLIDDALSYVESTNLISNNSKIENFQKINLTSITHHQLDNIFSITGFLSRVIPKNLFIGSTTEIDIPSANTKNPVSVTKKINPKLKKIKTHFKTDEEPTFDFELLGDVILKGKENSVNIYAANTV